MIVFVPKITSRVSFVFELIFNNILGIEIEITDDIQSFKTNHKHKISYGNFFGSEIPYFEAHTLLFERKIYKQQIDIETYKGLPIFFSNLDKNAVLPFDIFASSFYLVTRYEEYLPFEADVHGRFQATESLAYKNNFLMQPLVNQWCEILKNIISEYYPDINFPKKKLNFIPTFDIDSAFKYKNKGFIRNFGGFTKALINRDYAEIKERIQVLSNTISDPFNTLELAIELHKNHENEPILFFLLADISKFDKNISHTNSNFRNKIIKMSDYATIGVHPSYYSYNDENLLHEEINRLKDIVNYEPRISRQHFLRLSLPDTYNLLIQNGINQDHTMGYSYTPGFRASICTPFYFYDLIREYKTQLKIFPFALMEGALAKHLKLSVDKALAVVKELLSKVDEVGGTFITAWHNHTLSNDERSGEWLSLYTRILQEIEKINQSDV